MHKGLRLQACVIVLLLLVTGCDRLSDEVQPGATGADRKPGATATRSSAAPHASVAAAVAARQGPPVVPGKVMLGAFVSILGQATQPSLQLRRDQLGRDFRILHFYYEWNDQLPTAIPSVGAGQYPLLSWRGPSYSQILNGSQDAWIGKEADRLAQYGKPVFLRWAWEMNGSWYVWGGAHNNSRPQDFIAAWRHIHDIFQAHNAKNVGWVWGPNWYSKPDLPWNAMGNYYPGDDYVDWVAISGYGDSGLSPNTLYDAFYDQFASRKPLMIAETGVEDRGGTTKPDWIGALSDWTKKHPAIAAVVWYDTDHSPGTKENFRLDSTPASLEAFKTKLSSDPYFAG
ncbi:hypothetical protein Dvina_06190 [Dactylosporangium vinaceum]|uniref:Glycoside hydrolase family 26 protein n=1 Tax=Dactylosporangium vinaceum TaxID=53362 RepID=A0ABV5MN82_9ACTN|nr:glycosyl hydrolase [Dactylosporangium vinaceum]UAB97710.1 hypothetical protein Dvina_06190 [Dactylosporangium vinaceum]